MRSHARLAMTLWFALSLFAAAAAAEDPEPCTAQWLPDLQCDRSGRFEGFHKPIVQPFLFEDPFIVTGLYPYYAYHEFPNSSAMQGGSAQVAAMQARIAITDRLAFVATKDGRAWKNPGNPLLDDTRGWLNLAGGLKYALYQDPEKQRIVSATLRVEVPTGSTDVYQGYGDGTLMPSISAAFGFGAAHVIADLGLQAALGSEQSSFVFYHLYLDYTIAPRITPFVQLSAIHWIDSGSGELPVDLNIGVQLPLDTVQAALGTGPFEGSDVWNLGSRDAGGLEQYTAAIGIHLDLLDHLTWSVAYERPFSHDKGLFQQRVTSSLVFEY